MIEAMAGALAARVKRVVPEHPASEAVMKYSLTLIINGTSIIGLSLLISLVTGRFYEALTVLIAFALLRQMSGGIHLKSGTVCMVVSTVGVTLLSYASFSTEYVYGFTAVAALLALIYAPSRIEKQSRINPKYYPLLRVYSVLLISINFLIGSPVIAASFFLQGLTLIRKGR